MGLLMDGLLLAATLFAGTYCWVLARRVDALKDLDKGLGGAIARMTRQIELARTTLDEARASTREGRQDLAQLSARAEAAAGQLRLLLAAVNDPNGPEPARPRETPRPAPLRASREAPPAPRPATARRPAEPAPDALPKPRNLPPAPRARPEARDAAEAEASKGEAEILATLRALAGEGE